MSVVYFIQHGSEPLVKIGWARDAELRQRELQCGNPVPLAILATLPGPPALERSLHRWFVRDKARSEWFHLRGQLAELIGLAAHDTHAALRLITKIELDHLQQRVERIRERDAFEAAVAEAVKEDIKELRTKIGAAGLANIMGVTPPAVDHAAAGRSLPSLIAVLRIWAFDREALPRTRELVGFKLVPLKIEADEPPAPAARTGPPEGLTRGKGD